MKAIIVINNLSCGGGQKSLISLLNSLPSEVLLTMDLLVLNKKDQFFHDIPCEIRELKICEEYEAMLLSMTQLMRAKLAIKNKFLAIFLRIKEKILGTVEGNSVQRIWHTWKNYISMQEKEYDLAISYIDGFSNYYVIDKVSAKRKILWVHNEYEQLNYLVEYDRAYFKKADDIVTISDVCGDSLKRVFPELAEKIHVIPNLSPTRLIEKQANAFIPLEYSGKDNVIVSIGRLMHQKGFDIALDAFREIKDNGQKFHWFVLGEGEDEDMLKNKIDECGLGEHVSLLGVRANPYPYIKHADIFLQPSRFEGKSIVLDEAKILAKPIVATNYSSAKDSILSMKNGLLCEIDSHSIASAVMTLLNDPALQVRFTEALTKEKRNEREELNAYLTLFEN